VVDVRRLPLRRHTFTPLKLKSSIMTTKEEFAGNWNETKGKLKQKFAILTDNDLLLEDGKEDEMMGKLQQKLGKSKEALQDLISSLKK
jgi:uncharacterized protein YjbJ (UPF0337 family)